MTLRTFIISSLISFSLSFLGGYLFFKSREEAKKEEAAQKETTKSSQIIPTVLSSKLV